MHGDRRAAIALASVKGGVGKSTTAMNLAYLAAESGRRVLLWDLDPQGASTCAAGIDGTTRDALALVDAVLVPVLPTPLGTRTLEQLERAVAAQAVPPLVLAFFSMVDRRRRLHRDLVEAVQVHRPATLSAQVVDAAIVERMGERLDPVVRFAPQTGVAQGYRSLWAEVVDRVDGLRG
jgi:cellulose biosynthesis protein BcsQ